MPYTDELDLLNPDEFNEEDSAEDKELEDDNSNDEQVKTQEELDAEKKAQEQHERNEREKAKRLAREQKEREEREQKIKDSAKLEAELGMIKRNPYTDEKISDEEDLKIYKIQKEIEDSGGDPINDLPKKLADMRRKEKQELQAKQEQETKARDDLKKEIDGFHNRHKDITVDFLQKNGFFEVVDSEEYDGYSYAERVYDFVNKLNTTKKQSEEKKEEEIIDKNSKRMTKVPSSNSNGGKKTDIANMTDEEFKKWWNEKYA